MSCNHSNTISGVVNQRNIAELTVSEVHSIEAKAIERAAALVRQEIGDYYYEKYAKLIAGVILASVAYGVYEALDYVRTPDTFN